VNINEKILRWFANGETGISSKTMAMAAIDLSYHRASHPHDPSDFNRCLLLIDYVPEIRLAMHKIAALSDVWARLVDRWEDIEETFILEAGWNWSKTHSAPATYDLMQEIIKGPGPVYIEEV
jgi:hypothetical protein